MKPDMHRFLPDRVTLASALSGLLMALSFPLAEITLLAWFGLVPLVLVMRSRPFKSGFVAGLVFFAVVLYWVNIVMTTYGHLPLAASVICYLLLCIYLALYWGGATWAACRLKEYRNYPLSLTLPVFWVASEFLREFMLTGFPWATLGYSQQSWLTVIQSADLFGVYGLSYLLVLCSVALAEVFSALRQQPRPRLPFKSAVIAALFIACNYAYGHWRLGQDLDSRSQTLRTGLIQGNIPQDLKWHPDSQVSTVNVYREISLHAAGTGGTDLLVWPEAAMPFYYQDGGSLADSVDTLAAEANASLLFGSPAYLQTPGGTRYLNSAFLLSPSGQVLGRSDKVHLVPFGEYVPFGDYLPFVNKLVAGIGDFSAGEVTPLPLGNHHLGVLVCYEVIFPELARDYVRRGSDLLVNITNDAWFGQSSAPWQHLAMVRFRAIENRVWIVRAANTGVSAIIAPSGQVLQQTALFETTFLTGNIGLGARPGLYASTGDVLPGVFLLVGLGWLVQTRRRFF